MQTVKTETVVTTTHLVVEQSGGTLACGMDRNELALKLDFKESMDSIKHDNHNEIDCKDCRLNLKIAFDFLAVKAVNYYNLLSEKRRWFS